MKWISESWAFNDPCTSCGVLRTEHRPERIRHQYRSPLVSDESMIEGAPWDAIWPSNGTAEEKAIVRHAERTGYEAPLPSPNNRRRLREQAGWTQEDIAQEVFVNRTTVARWETPAGYHNGVRLNGREPTGESRKDYSKLLRSFET